jgi:predicted SAM-dependent methyltransferase
MQRRFRKLKDRKEVKINLGCGYLIEKDAIGIDLRDCGQDLIWDIRDGIPFADESVDLVCSSHFLEHLDGDESMDLFREIYRVLKPGGITEHILPHATDPTAYYFGHKSFWNEERVNTLPGVPGLAGFAVLGNITIERGMGGAKKELAFKLKKK